MLEDEWLKSLWFEWYEICLMLFILKLIVVYSVLLLLFFLNKVILNIVVDIGRNYYFIWVS